MLVFAFFCWFDNILVVFCRQCFDTSVSRKANVALTLIDPFKTFIHFKIEDYTAFAQSDSESMSSSSCIIHLRV